MQRLPVWFIMVCIGLCATHARAERIEAKTEKYTLALAVSPDTVMSKTQSAVTLTITPQQGLAFKSETPFKTTITANPKLALDKTELTAKDLVAGKGSEKSVTVPFTATQTGAHNLQADVSFFLCTKDVCERYKDKVQLKFNVK